MLMLKLLKENILYAVAIDQYHMLSLLVDVLKSMKKLKPFCILIDSINSHYRVEAAASEGTILFAELLTLLELFNRNNVFVITSAQIRHGEDVLPGYDYLMLWSDTVLEVFSTRTYRALRFHKPKIDTVFCFNITLSGVRWVKCYPH